MRTPILTPQQKMEYEQVKAEAAAMPPTATMEERFLMCRKLSIYAYGAQHLGEEERYILSRAPSRRYGTQREMEEADDMP